MSSERLRQTASISLAVIGAIHLLLAPEYLGKQAYLGALFVLGGVVGLAAAIVLRRADHAPSWGIGALIAAAMGVGFVLSRTVGLLGFQESEWELSGLVALVLEVGFLAAAGTWARAGLTGRRKSGRVTA